MLRSRTVSLRAALVPAQALGLPQPGPFLSRPHPHDDEYAYIMPLLL